MPTLALNPPKLGFVVVTRAAFALGAGLLIARRLPSSKSQKIGTALVAIGALTTIPAWLMLARSREPQG